MNDDLISLDYSRLKSSGYHYVAIGFSLPYALHLPIDSYDVAVEVNLENQSGLIEIQIIIENRWRNQEKRRQKFPFVKKNTLVERAYDTQASYRYTGVWVFIPVGSESSERPNDLDSLWEQVTRTRDWYLDMAVKSVNRLLEAYRYHSKECHIKPLAGRELWFDFTFAFMFNENPPQSLKSNFTTKLMPIIYWGDIYPQLSDVSDKIVSNIRAQLTSRHEVALAENLLLNAYDHLDRGNYRLAILEAETAFESAIHSHLRGFYSDMPDQLQKIERINSFTVLLKNPLCQKALGEVNFKETPLYPDWKSKVWEVRGDIVHGKRTQVSKQEANEAVRIVEEVLAYLLKRPNTKPYLFFE